MFAECRGRPAGRLGITKTKGGKARDVPVVALYRVLQPAARRAGVAGLHVYDLRHTASLMIAGGADVKKV